MTAKQIANRLLKTPEEDRFFVLRDCELEMLKKIADELDVPFDVEDEDYLLDRILNQTK